MPEDGVADALLRLSAARGRAARCSAPTAPSSLRRRAAWCTRRARMPRSLDVLLDGTAHVAPGSREICRLEALSDAAFFVLGLDSGPARFRPGAAHRSGPGTPGRRRRGRPRVAPPPGDARPGLTPLPAGRRTRPAPRPPRGPGHPPPARRPAARGRRAHPERDRAGAGLPRVPRARRGPPLGGRRARRRPSPGARSGAACTALWLAGRGGAHRTARRGPADPAPRRPGGSG
ncbi:hypothetical protein ACU686_30830 [Yinghuangia aomiensis]